MGSPCSELEADPASYRLRIPLLAWYQWNRGAGGVGPTETTAEGIILEAKWATKQIGGENE